MEAFFEFLDDKRWLVFPAWLDYELDVGKLTELPSAERQTAYKRARRELDGLIVLPEAAVVALEGRLAPRLDAGREPLDSRFG